MNDINKLTLDQLVQQIKDAFANTKYPGDDNLVYDNTEYHLSCKETRLLYMGKRWQSLNLEFLKRVPDNHHYLSAEGYRYYLPAFMVGAVVYGKKIFYVAESLTLALSLQDYDDKEANRHHFARFDGFNRLQRDAIRAYLSYAKIHLVDEFYQKDIDAGIRFWKMLD